MIYRQQRQGGIIYITLRQGTYQVRRQTPMRDFRTLRVPRAWLACQLRDMRRQLRMCVSIAETASKSTQICHR